MKRQYSCVVSGGQFRERCPQFKLASVPKDTDHMQATKVMSITIYSK